MTDTGQAVAWSPAITSSTAGGSILPLPALSPAVSDTSKSPAKELGSTSVGVWIPGSAMADAASFLDCSSSAGSESRKGAEFAESREKPKKDLFWKAHAKHRSLA